MQDPVNLIDPSGLAPGDRYNSEADAAYAALTDVNLTSMLISREIGGTIYPLNGGFTYSVPKILGPSSGNIQIHPNTTAIYHTHGSLDPGFDNNNFSPVDLNTSRSSMLNMYLMTPDKGPMQFFSPLSGGLDRCRQ